jgi:1-phosphatidylinositol phosphodiesterase
VVMDFVGEGGDWDMVRLVVGMNMGVLMKVDGTS